MGIRIHRNTWSAPLQLIDSWLPPSRSVAHPLSVAAQRFVQAGWLQRRASNDEPSRPAVAGRRATQQHHATQPMRARAQPPRDTRVLLSGRMTDVCAELDRLVELETAGLRAHG